MKILSVCFGITYISYIVEYSWLPTKLVIVRAFTHTCLKRVLILKDEYTLTPIQIKITTRYIDLSHRSWKELNFSIPYW